MMLLASAARHLTRPRPVPWRLFSSFPVAADVLLDRKIPGLRINGARSFSSSTTGGGSGSFDEPEASMWDKPDLHRIFDNNKAWRKEMLAKDPDFFKKMFAGQAPEYLLIGCSDSRVGAQEIMGLRQGELFVHRNIANVVVSTDLNLLSVLFYAVNVLKVKDILVLGHYQCGGVRAASENKDLGLIEHWLHNVRDVQRLHKEELAAIADPEERHRRLVELNVQEQCLNLFSNSIVQQMQAKTGRPRIHGLVYDIEDGLLKYLDIDFKSQVREMKDIYTVADFRRHTPINISELSEDTKQAEAESGEEEKETDRLVVIRPTGGQDVPRPLRCHASTTILKLKQAIQKLTGTQVEYQNLYHNGIQLKDDGATLQEVGIADISEVELREEIVPSAFKRP